MNNKLEEFILIKFSKFNQILKIEKNFEQI